jgi:hypothetical protein
VFVHHPLVVIPSLEKIDFLFSDPVDQSVLLSDTARPTPGEHIFQWFGLSRALEGISDDLVNEIEDSDGYASVVFDPETEVLKKLGLEYGNTLRLSPHRASLSAKQAQPSA